MKMKFRSQIGWRLFALVALLALVVQPSFLAEAAEVRIKPTTEITVAPAQIRTREDMEQSRRAASLVPEAVEVPFRPTMSAAEYEQAKAEAASGGIFGLKGPSAPSTPLAPPTMIFQDIEGVDQIEACGTCRPPDTHGAVGFDQFVEITNFNINVFDKATGAPLMSVRLANFFGYFTQTIFDPRVVYDSTWNRWVISAEARPESPTVQFQFLAISQSSDATGPFFLYRINVNFFGNDDFWDFPQLGMDQDAVVITANVFAGPTGPFREARLFAVAKARLYNGLDFSGPLFTGLVATPAPPIVLDQNFRTFVVAARPGPITITKYTLENSSRPNGATLVASTITVPAFSIPPDAPQPGTTHLLDTSDARFVNASTQNGDSLWNVHTINFSGFATPRFYELNTATDTVIQSGDIVTSLTSHDWNASIAANDFNDVYVTWSSTDPPAGTNAQVRFSGRQAADPAGMIGAGTALFTSPTFYSPTAGLVERWGDYSAVTVDPVDPNKAWIVNEKINDTTTWGSRIGNIGF